MTKICFCLATKMSRNTKYLTCILKKLLNLSWLFDNGMKLLHWQSNCQTIPNELVACVRTIGFGFVCY